MATQDRPKRRLPRLPDGSTKHRNPKFGVQVSVYLSPLFSTDYRPLCEAKLGVSGSFRLNELMLADLASMQGQTVPSQANIDALEMQLANLIVRIKKLKGFLVKIGSYSDLEDLARDWRLNVETFCNLDAVVERFLRYDVQKSDRFSRDDVELFVQLLNLVKQKALRKNELDKLRLDRINGVVAPVPPASHPEPSPATTPNEPVSVVAPASVAAEVPAQSQSEIVATIEEEILDGEKPQGDVDRVAELLEDQSQTTTKT
jgi:hypothetical protein